MLKVGVVGLGRWGKVLVRAAQSKDGPKGSHLRFVACHTRSPAKAADFIDEMGLKNFDNYDDMLMSGMVDAIAIASPHSQHVAQITAAARAGVHVFTEKPLALDADDALTCIRACTRAKLVLGVGQNRRFLPAYQHLQSLVRDGALGTILHVEGSFSGPFGLRFTKEAWHASSSETPAGGMTLMGIHVLDSMIGLVGPIVGVQARSLRQALAVELDDTTDATLHFATGCTGYLSTITATALHWRLQVYGTGGWAAMSDPTHLAIRKIDQEVETIAFPAVDAELRELEAFAQAVAGTAGYPVPHDDVVNGIATLAAIAASVNAATPVPVMSSRIRPSDGNKVHA